MIRRVVGLEWAEPAENPWGRVRAKGVKAQGLAYERLLAKTLPQAKHNLWFRFKDQNGPGMCSPDFVLLLNGRVVVIECKLTDCVEAEEQLLGLYLPVLGFVLGQVPRAVVVAKNLTPASARPSPDLYSAMAWPGLCPRVHWSGRGSFPLGRDLAPGPGLDLGDNQCTQQKPRRLPLGPRLGLELGV